MPLGNASRPKEEHCAARTTADIVFQSNFANRNLRALVITLTDDIAIAPAPMTGDNRTPKAG